MPGGVGLAINHAFFHGMPILIEDVNHSPEAYYLKPGENGFIFNKGDATDLAKKIRLLLTNEELYAEFSKNALETTTTGEASFSNMTDGFVRALEYTRNK
jgi:glycosyltransferase involved in cell wall biosynthesis